MCADDQVGDVRPERPVFGDLDPHEPKREYRTVDLGFAGAGASADEAALHIVPDDDNALRDDYDLFPDEDLP